MVNRANIKISYEIFLYMLGIKPGVAGWEASILSNVLCSPLCSATLLLMGKTIRRLPYTL